MGYPIPPIGTSGVYTFTGPFTTSINTEEKRTCKSIRTISDYLANNDDVKQTVYLDQGLTETEYDSALDADMPIVSLQSTLGHWLHIPANYITKYPDVNGKVYRAISIGLSLPSMLMDTDYAFILPDLINVVEERLGVTPSTKIIETSRPVQVDIAKHDALVAIRATSATNKTTDRARVQQLLVEQQVLQTKITQLESFIINQL